MKKRYLTCSLLLAAGLSSLYAQSQGVLSPHTQLRTDAQTQSRADRPMMAYVTVDPTTLDRESLNEICLSVGLDLGDIITVRVLQSDVEALSRVDGVKYIQCANAVEQTLDIARPEIGMQAVHEGKEAPKPYSGKGVIVGIIDSGFDYNHAAFKDATGGLRIKRVWEQAPTPNAGQVSPERYGYGIELTTPEAISAAGGDIRNNSHGSHVTSIAAGADSYMDSSLVGMAPDADIVLVSMTDPGEADVAISDAIAYIFDYADQMDMPCVINISLGAQNGPHDGTSTFDVIADRLQGPGRLIVGAAGNFRSDAFHVRRGFNGADDDALRTVVNYYHNPSERNIGGDIEIWGDVGMDMEVALFSYKTSTNTIADRVVVYPPAEPGVNEIALGRNISGHFNAVAEISPLNGKPHLLLSSAVTAMRTGYVVGLEIVPKSSGTVDVWADNTSVGLSSKDAPGFTGPNGEPTIAEIGGTAKRIFTVGAYTTRSKYTLMGETTEHSLNETVGDISSFSSYGPTADGRMKPQVAAPGCFISAAVSSFDGSGTLSYSGYHKDGKYESFYGYMQGTSMAAPVVTGVVATWLEAYPELSPETLVEIVSNTARKDEYTGALPTGNNDWGYGKIDALVGLKECLSRSGAGIDDVSVNNTPMAFVSAVGGLISIMFNHSFDSLDINLYNVNGAEVYSGSYDNIEAGEIVSLNQQLTSGVYLITLKSSNSIQTLKIKIYEH